MPNPSEYETQAEWMKVCVPKMIEEGREQDQAVAACISMWNRKDDAEKSVEMITFGDAVKVLSRAENSIKIGGYLVRFGSNKEPDVSDTHDYFTAETDFGLGRGEKKKVPVYFNHTLPIQSKDGRTIIIDAQVGDAEISIDNVGVLAEAILYNRKRYEQEIARNYKNLSWSSGVPGHLITREPNKDGTNRVARWIIAEASVTPTPAEYRAENRLVSIKSLLEQPEAQHSAAETNLKGNKMSDEKEKVGLTPEEVQKQIDAALAARDAKEQEAAKAAADFEAAVKAKVDEKVAAMKAELAKGRRLPDFDGIAPHQSKYAETRPYDGLDAGDTAVLIGALKSAHKPVSNAAYNALSLKLEEDKTAVGEEGRNAMKAVGIKTGEIDYSTSAGYGDEWVGIAYSGALWESIRVNTFVLGKLPQIEVPQGYESIYLPLESTDPIWYNVAENTTNGTTVGSPAPTITSSRIATGRALLTLSKLGARVTWSGEMEESSLIPFAAQVRNQLAVSGAEYLESAIIDGDTETGSGANINNNGGAIVTGGHYLAFDGFRKSCLVTTTANSRSGGALSVEDFLETVKLMGGAGINALDTTKVSFIIDPNVNWKFISLPEFLTRDVSGNPTLEGGKLSQIWGYGVNVSGSMHFMSSVRKCDSAGYVDTTTPTNNLYGAILAVRWDQWKLGWRRRMTMETTRFANSDTNEIVAMLRVGLKQRDIEASAISYAVVV